MTEEQFHKRYDDLIIRLPEILRDKAKELLESGAINLTDYDDNYLLPKLILVTALKYASEQCAPYTAEHKQIVKNLSKF